MDDCPIELIENILLYCTGSRFSQCSRVSRNWLRAQQNIERTSSHFWRICCRTEIETSLLEHLNPYNDKTIDELGEYKCKQIYIQWFRGRTIGRLTKNSVKYNQTFGSSFSSYENITTIRVTGTLVITGHRSGKVNLIDCRNDQKPIQIAQHMEPINDLALVNLVGQERYEFHKPSGCAVSAYPSYSNHHHIISVGEDSRIFISLIADSKGDKPGKPFEICPLTQRHFLKVRISKNLFAVSTKEAVDISLFRLVLPKPGVVPIKESLTAELITTVSCRQIFNNTNNWLGLFSFSDIKLKCFCYEFNLIACSDVALNLSLMREENFSWNWSPINELIYEFQSHSSDTMADKLEYLSIKVMNGFSFGDGIFFLITNQNQIVYSIDSKTFKVCPLEHWLRKYDKITTISLFGSVLACGTCDGYVYLHHCPTLKRPHYITHFKPLFAESVCKDPILSIALTDNGIGPVLGVATRHTVHLLNWTPEEYRTQALEVIQIDD